MSQRRAIRKLTGLTLAVCSFGVSRVAAQEPPSEPEPATAPPPTATAAPQPPTTAPPPPAQAAATSGRRLFTLNLLQPYLELESTFDQSRVDTDDVTRFRIDTRQTDRQYYVR